MEKTGSLILIPDISGFTSFVKHNDISHSEHIISELLEVIINSNLLDLKIADIGGDEVFFYVKDYLKCINKVIRR